MAIRRLLHPVTVAVALSLLVLAAAASLGHVAGAPLLLVLAGAAAGFANSGST